MKLFMRVGSVGYGLNADLKEFVSCGRREHWQQFLIERLVLDEVLQSGLL